MIVCVCNNISDREIRQAMELGITSMEELRRDLGVATCCGQCFNYAEDILNQHLASTEAQQLQQLQQSQPAPAFAETVLKRPVFTN